ncbi:AsmA family protein [Flavobacteriaceae bacterium]|jgi:hypothetical protein|nr:AsmA family protein [Flavobacteriaceae bacterium]
MKNIKDITISIFAIIGFVAILSSFNNQPQSQTNYGTPESHIWELVEISGEGMAINKVTGETILYSPRINASKVAIGLKEYKATPLPYGENK